MDVQRTVVYLLGSFLLSFLGILPSIEGKHGVFQATVRLSSNNCSDLRPAAGNGINPCLPRITGQHLNLYCLDNADADRLPAPTVVSPCSAIRSLEYQDRYLELNSQDAGFQGYFAPSNWTVIKNLGDGGVDVTGAPNEQLVEGANNTLISVAPGSRLAIQIAIPADGLITFHWSKIGGSNLFPADFSVKINEQVTTVSRRATPKGAFRTPFLHRGDQFSLMFTPQQETSLQLELDSFNFLTAAIGIIERSWTATDEEGHQGTFRQFISIERPNLSDVIFPEDRDGITAPALGSENSIAPASTGFPLIDRDGDLATTHDQYRLDKGTPCGLEVRWSDELHTLGREYILLRHWKIIDRYGSNTMEETQLIRLMQQPGPDSELFQLILPDLPEISNRPENHVQECEYTTL